MDVTTQMKIIKLTKNYTLYKRGYTHALRFAKWESNVCDPIEKKMEQMFGTQWRWDRPTEWQATFGSSKSPRTGHKPYFIAVRNESYLTMALLTLKETSK